MNVLKTNTFVYSMYAADGTLIRKIAVRAFSVFQAGAELVKNYPNNLFHYHGVDNEKFVELDFTI